VALIFSWIFDTIIALFRAGRCAQTENIVTSKTIDIKTPDGQCDSYISCPNAGGPFAAVLFYMDGIGIRPVLREMAEAAQRRSTSRKG
jgi:hypothetical protein